MRFSRQKKISKSHMLVYGVLILGILLSIRVISASFLHVSLPSHLQDLITLATSIIIESLPFVLLGIILSIVVQVWLPDGFIIKLLPKWAPLRRICISLLGVFLPVCECGNVPLARGLLLQGFTVSESLVFLIAAPILNPITIITTYQAFGADSTILVTRILGGFFIANIIGWIYSAHKNPESLLTDAFAASCQNPDQHVHAHKKTDKSIDIFIREANNILPALFIGALCAAIIQVLVPRTILTSLGGDPVLSIIAMMALAFIVAICSNVDAFFALAFKHTFTTGSLTSFLVFGPIIDIKMLALMKTTYKAKTLVQLTLLITLMSALLGLVVNYAF